MHLIPAPRFRLNCFLFLADLLNECPIITCNRGDKLELFSVPLFQEHLIQGEMLISLNYLPTAERLTVGTVQAKIERKRVGELEIPGEFFPILAQEAQVAACYCFFK